VSRILIAEDEPRIAAFLDKGLRASGYATTVAADGDAALEAALSGQFDLLLLDLILPRKHGFPVLSELRGARFLLAETFVRNAGQVLSRQQLLSHVWGYGHDPGSNVVDVDVCGLRRKLGSGAIQTVRGMGYRLDDG
jgi:two-component system, OmpR family, copper resistance phosphate regulon response regulator CusR